MAKTYTLTSTDMKGGNRSGWNSGYWGAYSLFANTGARQLIGGDPSTYFATYIKFNSSTLATLRTKTVTSVKLTFTVKNGIIPGNGSESYAIGLAANSLAGTTSQNDAWQRKSVNDAPSIVGRLCNQTPGGGSINASNTQITIDVTGAGVPEYGYVIGPNNSGVKTAYVELVTSGTATLTVTTNETDYNYTLSYNANGGSGAPSNQTGSNTGTSPSYTFPVSSTAPTRTGYTFQGWSLSSTATTPSYVGGNNITVTSAGTTTLYAVWKIVTYTVSYNANGGSGAPAAQTKTYGVYLELSGTAPTRTNYIFQGWATSSTGAVAYQPYGTYTANADVTLYAIWQASTATLSSVTSSVQIGTTDGGSASWTSIDSSYTYRLKLSCGSAPVVTVTAAAWTGSRSVSFTIPNTWLNTVTSAASATATATLETLSGSTVIGTSAKTFTVTVPASVKPSISSFTAAHYAANATVRGWGTFTQGYSQAGLSVTASAGTGASITAIAFSGPGINSSGTVTTAWTAVIDSSGTKTYTVTVTDSRGRVATATLSVYVYPYASPTITGISVARVNADGTANNASGTYLSAMPVYSISSVNGKNTITSQVLEYSLHGSSAAIASKTCASGTTYKPTGTMWAVAITGTYDVSVTVQDALGNTTTFTTTLPSASGVWLRQSNDGIGFGSIPPGPGLHCDWNATFNGVVDVTPRRTSAYLSTPGWYRVLTFVSSSDSAIVGAFGFQIDFVINRSFWTLNNEIHRVTLSLIYNGAKFVDELSRSNYFGITKIRYNTNTVGDIKFGYVDIYYDLTSSNPVYVDFTVHQAAESIQSAITASGLTGVAPSPANETVMESYDFIATSGKRNTFTPSSGTADFGGCWYARNGEYVTVHVGLRNLTANTPLTIGTLPIGYRPIAPCCSAGSSAIYDAEAHLYVRDTGDIEVWSPNNGAILDATFMWR